MLKRNSERKGQKIRRTEQEKKEYQINRGLEKRETEQQSDRKNEV